MAAITSIKQSDGQLVPRPRSTDAIGGVLRGAFACPPLPEDMLQLLRSLDCKSRN